MANRYRNKRLEIKLTEEEYELFKEKMKMANCKTMAHFIRKCVLEKEIFVINMTHFYRMQHLLGNEARNLNQIAKRVNSTGIIYKDDINDLKKSNEKISKELASIHSLLLKRF